MDNAAIYGDRPCVGVVIPVRSRPVFVCDALASVAAQTRLPDRLIVVDDGSDDDTADTVASWLQQHDIPDAQLIRQAKRGAAAARNAGMRRCESCDFVAFLDSDDLWPADFLERTVEQLLKAPDAVAVSVNKQKWKLGTGRQELVSHVRLAKDPIQWIFQFDAGVGSCTLLRSRAVRQVSGFPEEYDTGHDILFFGRVALLGPWLFAPGEPVVFRRLGSNANGQLTHIRRTIANPRLQWAAAKEVLAKELRAARRVPADFKTGMARQWQRAGETAACNGDIRQSLHSYGRSLLHDPMRLETWRSMVAAVSRSPRRPPGHN